MNNHRPSPPTHPTFHRSPYPLVVVLGPSASGKSELALEIAGRFQGEIINFDSVQVYRHFNIGTAKLAPDQRRGILHHLIDCVEPDELFTAGDYARRAREVLADIRARARLPVMTGGTGFYLRALLQGLFQGPQRDEALRQRLESQAESKPRGYLHRLLQRLDAASAGRIHPNDTPKVIRAIEVCLRGRAPMSSQWQQGRDGLTGYDIARIGLDPGRSQLRERIGRRSEAMFATGLVEEAQGLLDGGVSRKVRPFGSLGYRQALDYLDGLLTIEEAIEQTSTLTGRYAKRQETWFRREPNVTWFQGFGDEGRVQEKALQWLQERIADQQPG